MEPRQHAFFSNPSRSDGNMQNFCSFSYGDAFLTTSPASASGRGCTHPSRLCPFTDTFNGSRKVARVAGENNFMQMIRKTQTELATMHIHAGPNEKPKSEFARQHLIRRGEVACRVGSVGGAQADSDPEGAMPMPPCRHAATGSVPGPQMELGKTPTS